MPNHRQGSFFSPTLLLLSLIATKIEEEPTSDEETATEKPTLASLYDAHVHKVVANGIRLRTSAEALASGRRGENCRTKAGKKREAFPGVSIYCKMFPGTIIQ